MQTYLQINCDLGEGVFQEERLLPWIDAASVACGGHFGDRQSIKATLESCHENNVKVGAHPSYPDQENFGRKSLQIPFQILKKALLVQIRLFEEVLPAFSLSFDHIKFHGALYNDAAKSSELAIQLTDFLAEFYPEVPVFVPPFSELEKAALNNKLTVRREIFGDRSYTSHYQLVGRDQENALLTNFDLIDRHLESIFTEGSLLAISGEKLPIEAETLCFHGDNPGIHQFLPLIRQKYRGFL